MSEQTERTPFLPYHAGKSEAGFHGYDALGFSYDAMIHSANDANGNTLTDAQGRTYTWDFENRLTQVVNPGVGTTTFKYDPFGRRIQKSGPLGTTNYLYDGANIVEEVDGAANILARFLHGPRVDQPLAQGLSGTVSNYESDGLGSITSVTDSSETVQTTYNYDGGWPRFAGA